MLELNQPRGSVLIWRMLTTALSRLPLLRWLLENLIEIFRLPSRLILVIKLATLHCQYDMSSHRDNPKVINRSDKTVSDVEPTGKVRYATASIKGRIIAMIICLVGGNEGFKMQHKARAHRIVRKDLRFFSSSCSCRCRSHEDFRRVLSELGRCDTH